MFDDWHIGIIYLGVEIAGIAVAMHAILYSRTAQGATAWTIALVTFPVVTLPLYAAFGRRKFEGYIAARAADDREVLPLIDRIMECDPQEMAAELNEEEAAYRTFEKLAHRPFTHGNRALLLINGHATFAAILQAIDKAQHYVLIQSYIIRDDGLGQALRERLLARLSAGIKVFLLYDEIGSFALTREYTEGLRAAGAETEAFTGGGKRRNRFQINFRNHRKIVVVDGDTGFVGGHNVGDEYLGKDPTLSPWRDTHVQIRGPCVLGLQISFTEDWYWVTHRLPELTWRTQPCPDVSQRALVVSSGPADAMDTCGLLFVHAINSAQWRIWLVSPYFVPDESLVSALQLAALRGVDVRILLPERADHRLVHLAGYSYLREIAGAGAKLFRYQRGFLHQKVMLIDDRMASISTANLDNRSLRLNFEVSALILDNKFAREVENMLEVDFAQTRRVSIADIEARSFWFRAAARLARLFAPVL